MSIVKRMREQELGGFVEQAAGVRAFFGKRARAESFAHLGRCLGGRHRPARQRIEMGGDAIHELVARFAEAIRGEFEWRSSIRHAWASGKGALSMTPGASPLKGQGSAHDERLRSHAGALVAR